MTSASQQFSSEIDAEWLAMMGGVRKAVVYIGTEALARATKKSPVDVEHFKTIGWSALASQRMQQQPCSVRLLRSQPVRWHPMRQ